MFSVFYKLFLNLIVTLRNAKFTVNVSDKLMSEMGIGEGIRTDKVD